MKKLFCIAALFFTLNTMLYAQSEQLIIKGTVLSDDTMEPLPFAHIIIRSTGTTSNIYGKFAIKVSTNDTLHFSYIGYQRKTMLVSDFLSNQEKELEIILLKDITFLKSITITSLPESLSDFKEELLTTEMPVDIEIENAKKA